MIKIDANFILPHTINLPTSKSYANRYLILASLRGNVHIHDIPSCDDVDNLILALGKIGIDFEKSKKSIAIKNSFPQCEIQSDVPIEINVGEGGTTARFLAALLSLGKNKYTIKLEGKLADRPWDDLLNFLSDHGAKITKKQDTISIQGPMTKNIKNFVISGKLSSQFASAIQLVLPEFRFILKDETSTKYFEMTQLVNSLIGHETKIPKDWSSASYPIIMSLYKNLKTIFEGLSFDPFQADSILFNLLKERNAINETSDGVEVSKLNNFSALQGDYSFCPDLIPTLIIWATKLQGDSHIVGLRTLVHKESNRFEGILKILDQAKIHYETDYKNEIKIRGPQEIDYCEISPYPDHRLVMVSALLLALNKGGVVKNHQCVTKSYPSFFEDLGII